ncbi:MAG TPA: nucleotidyltransferase family protein [Candidatus Udaeobacter sp.]|jgi:molybdenum cofactor cytidylyltransferase|nr:nucleotidyltransferase family protein [Candidatus Udaeobacter sp.]
MISAIVLAAGRARRMGEQKLLLPLRDKPVLQWVLEGALASNVDEVICVVRDLVSVRRGISVADQRLHWLVNYAADRGQSTSVIAGLWAMDPKSTGALFLVGDQPMIQPQLLNALIARFERSAALIVASAFQGRTKNPVLFRRELFPELIKLTGDRGGRALIDKHREKTEIVDWNDEAPFMDLDVREDYERLKGLANQLALPTASAMDLYPSRSNRRSRP